MTAALTSQCPSPVFTAAGQSALASSPHPQANDTSWDLRSRSEGLENERWAGNLVRGDRRRKTDVREHPHLHPAHALDQAQSSPLSPRARSIRGGMATSVPRALCGRGWNGVPACLGFLAGPAPLHRPLKAQGVTEPPLLKPLLPPLRDCLEPRGDTESKPHPKLPFWGNAHQIPTHPPRNPTRGSAVGARSEGSKAALATQELHTWSPRIPPPSSPSRGQASQDPTLRRAASRGTPESHPSRGDCMERRRY